MKYSLRTVQRFLKKTSLWMTTIVFFFFLILFRTSLVRALAPIKGTSSSCTSGSDTCSCSRTPRRTRCQGHMLTHEGVIEGTEEEEEEEETRSIFSWFTLCFSFLLFVFPKPSHPSFKLPCLVLRRFAFAVPVRRSRPRPRRGKGQERTKRRGRRERRRGRRKRRSSTAVPAGAPARAPSHSPAGMCQGAARLRLPQSLVRGHVRGTSGNPQAPQSRPHRPRHRCSSCSSRRRRRRRRRGVVTRA